MNIKRFMLANCYDTMYNQGEWTWLDGQPWDFARWGENEPNGGNTENCLELVKWAEWVRSVFPFDCICICVCISICIYNCTYILYLYILQDFLKNLPHIKTI